MAKSPPWAVRGDGYATRGSRNNVPYEVRAARDIAQIQPNSARYWSAFGFEQTTAFVVLFSEWCGPMAFNFQVRHG